jgi:hypothetical protein
VDDDHVERFIGMWYHWTGDTPTREAAIAAITPYADSNREETFLHLLSMLLESLPNDVEKVDMFMEEWNGKYTEMFENLLGVIRERESTRESLDITSSLALALAAAAAKDDASVEYGLVEFDVDQEVFGDDAYMPPPDVSGKKRRMNLRSNSQSNLVP